MSATITHIEKKKMPAPKLRFKEFEGDWKPELLGNTCRVTTGGKDTQNRIDSGAYPFFVRSNTVERINSYSFDGEAILTSGDGVGVGKNFHYINGKFDFHQRVYALLEFKENYSGKFIYQLFVEKFHKRVMRLSAKNSVDSVRMNMITEMDIGFPTLPEQKKIASFLSAVDKKIQQLTRKKELLEQYKKGVMQQLFSGKLRFKDENGKTFPKWEEKRLGDLFKFFRGSPISKSDLSETGKYDCIHYGELFTSYSEIIKSIKSKTDLENGFLSIKGDILMPSSDVTPKGLAKASSILIDNVILGGDMNILRPSNDSDSVFFSYLLNFNQQKIIQKVTGTTVKHIYNKDVNLLEFNIPKSLEEQQKIANYLSKIDNKIESVNKQITQTQTFKKGLLQQMFV